MKAPIVSEIVLLHSLKLGHKQTCCFALVSRAENVFFFYIIGEVVNFSYHTHSSASCSLAVHGCTHIYWGENNGLSSISNNQATLTY